MVGTKTWNMHKKRTTAGSSLLSSIKRKHCSQVRTSVSLSARGEKLGWGNAAGSGRHAKSELSHLEIIQSNLLTASGEIPCTQAEDLLHILYIGRSVNGLLRRFFCRLT